MLEAEAGYSDDIEISQQSKTPIWMIIYTDMITNLMIFFLLSYCLTWLNDTDKKIAAESFSKAFGAPVAAAPDNAKGLARQVQSTATDEENLEKSARQQFSNVEVNADKIKIILPSPVLFDSGKAILKEQTKKTLHEISVLIKNNKNRVIVEGHTDDTPVGKGSYASNWELSAARAFSVIEYLINAEGIDPKRVSALGYGEFRPKYPNDTPQNRAGNRRIDISILKLK